MHINTGDSTWIVNRTVDKPYMCTLYIEDIRLPDSGEYYCEVKISSVHSPVISGPLHVEVASENFNSNELVLETTIPAGALVLILLVIVVLVVGVYYFVVARRRRRPVPAPVPGEDQDPLVQCKIDHLYPLRIYTSLNTLTQK